MAKENKHSNDPKANQCRELRHVRGEWFNATKEVHRLNSELRVVVVEQRRYLAPSGGGAPCCQEHRRVLVVEGVLIGRQYNNDRLRALLVKLREHTYGVQR